MVKIKQHRKYTWETVYWFAKAVFDYWVPGHGRGFKINQHQPCPGRASSLGREILTSWLFSYICKCKFQHGGQRCWMVCEFKSHDLPSTWSIVLSSEKQLGKGEVTHTFFYSGQRNAAAASVLILFTSVPRPHSYFPGLCGPERYTTTMYFISLMAFPNSPQSLLALPALSLVYVYTQAHIQPQSLGVPYLIIPSCRGSCSSSDNNDNTNRGQHSDRTYCVPGNVLGTMHVSTDLTLTTAIWGRY